jgi:hypothetical protein
MESFDLCAASYLLAVAFALFVIRPSWALWGQSFEGTVYGR